MEGTFTVMVFNADASKRHEDINNSETLSTFLHKKILEYSECVITGYASRAKPPLPRAVVPVQGSSNVPVDKELGRLMASLSVNGSERPSVATSASALAASVSADWSDGKTALLSSRSRSPLSSSQLTSLLADFNGLFTVSEFHQAAYDLLLEMLIKDKLVEGIWINYATNKYLASYWNANKWERDTDFAELNDKRYSAVVLKHISINKSLLYVSVHLSREDVKERMNEIQEIRRLIEANKQTYPAWIIAGDFNMKPSDIVLQFGSDMTPAISKDDEKTTRASRSIDNILMSDAIELCDYKIDRDETRLKHYPMYAVLRFKDN